MVPLKMILIHNMKRLILDLLQHNCEKLSCFVVEESKCACFYHIFPFFVVVVVAGVDNGMISKLMCPVSHGKLFIMVSTQTFI